MVVLCDLVHDVEAVLTATFFDLHGQCRIVLKFNFSFVCFFALWLLYVT